MNKKISLIGSDLCARGCRRVYLLAEVLAKLSFEVKVLGFSTSEALPVLPPVGINVQWVSYASYPRVIGSIKSLLKEIDGEIILPVKLKPTSFGVALLKRLRGKQKIVLDLDGWELSYLPDNWKYRPSVAQLLTDILQNEGMLRVPDSALYLQLSEQFLDKADAITVNSKLVQTRVGGTYLPNGTDVDLFDYQKYPPEEYKEKYGFSSYKLLMFAGSVTKERGLEDILAAMDILNRPDLKLVVVGGKSSSDVYAQELLSKWPEWVVKVPLLPREQMPEILAMADMVVLPWRENLLCALEVPLQLTEAMAMAKPIIATPIGDMPDILSDTGYLVNPSAIEQIAESISWILDNPTEAANQGLRARDRCVNNYSFEKMGAILSRIFESF